jgi:hypothetical protein
MKGFRNRAGGGDYLPLIIEKLPSPICDFTNGGGDKGVRAMEISMRKHSPLRNVSFLIFNLEKKSRNRVEVGTFHAILVSITFPSTICSGRIKAVVSDIPASYCSPIKNISSSHCLFMKRPRNRAGGGDYLPPIIEKLPSPICDFTNGGGDKGVGVNNKPASNNSPFKYSFFYLCRLLKRSRNRVGGGDLPPPARFRRFSPPPFTGEGIKG